MTQNISSVYQIRKTGSGQFLPPGQIYLSPGLAKIAPWCLARRESFSTKAPGLTVGVAAPPTLTAPTRRRYSQCERYQRDRLHRDHFLINRDRLFGTFAFARHKIQPTCKSKRAKFPRSQ